MENGNKTDGHRRNGLAAGQIVTNAEPEEGWDGFFEKSYHVGEENLQSGIPKTIILEIASQAALRLRESAMTITSAQEKRYGLQEPIACSSSGLLMRHTLFSKRSEPRRNGNL